MAILGRFPGMDRCWKGVLLMLTAGVLCSPGHSGPTSQEKIPPLRTVTADAEGVLRWQDNNAEAAFFGVNYVAPFSYTYRAIGYVKASPEETIRRDVQHLKRMGLNALRVHIWDNQISDTEGNLLVNDHLRLLDYLIRQCQEQKIHVLLTAIGWLGNGYPEADRPAPGFSSQFRKSETGTNPTVIRAQAEFLRQLVSHMNPYTGVAYKDDPTLVGFELLNEPWSPPAEKLTEFVDTLAGAVRATGCRKPLFYCASQSAYRQHNDALQASGIEGVTFGWYPSGLVSRRTLHANFLPHIDDYPLMRDAAFAKKVKMVYEFDAADIEGTYMYPAFARTFRTHGIQWATQFAYCPLPLADTNTPYPTHYLNLTHTPGKAVSMLIAAEAFRTLPRGQSYGHYPENTNFGPFRVSYTDNRSEMVTDTAYLYSNDTVTTPPKPELLERVVGCGSSPIVRYEGTGSYFLEKQQPGVWRLEVFPDAVAVDDPHGQPRLDRPVSRLVWQKWTMTLNLLDIGSEFIVKPINAGNKHEAQAKKGAFTIQPGIYLLTKKGTPFTGKLPSAEFAWSASENAPPFVVHQPTIETVEGKPLRIEATIAASPLPKRVTLHYRTTGTGTFQRTAMRREKGYRYVAAIPADQMRPGQLEYRITLDGTKPTTPETVLYDARRLPDASKNGANSPPHVLRLSWGDDWAGFVEVPLSPTDAASSQGHNHRRPQHDEMALLVRARALHPEIKGVEVELVKRDGESGIIEAPLTTDWQTVRLPLTSLRPNRGYIVLRRPEPRELSALRFRLPRGSRPDAAYAFGVEIETISYGPLHPTWEIPVRPKNVPPLLFDAVRDYANLLAGAMSGQNTRMASVSGKGSQALSMEVQSFARTREFSLRSILGERWATLRMELSPYDALRIRARARYPQTGQFELALIDRDGTAWAANVPLTADWNDSVVPLTAFRPRTVGRVPVAYPSRAIEPLPVRENRTGGFPITNLEAVQFSLPAMLYERGMEGPHGVEIERVSLAKVGEN